MKKATKTPTASSTRRRSKKPLRLEWIEAGSLADNPRNWRRHPEGQTKALKRALADVGWAGALLYNETTGHLVDGHARKDAVDPKTPVPVLVGRWTPAQEAEILVTLDPLATMAQANGEMLEGLMAEVDLTAPEMGDLAELLDEIVAATEENEDETKPGGEKETRRARKLSELYSVIVECKNEREQLAFFRRMQKEGRKCKLYVL